MLDLKKILLNRLRVELVVVVIAFVGLCLEFPLGLFTLCSFIRYTQLSVSLLITFIVSHFIKQARFTWLVELVPVAFSLDSTSGWDDPHGISFMHIKSS